MAKGWLQDRAIRAFPWRNAVLPRPQAIFASAPASGHDFAADGAGSKSRRPLETVSMLAEKLNVEIDLRFSKGQEVALARVLSGTPGTTLVCWQHEDIVAIASALSPRPAQFPHDWPPDRFNIAFDSFGMEERMHNGPSTSSYRSCSKTIARARYNREVFIAVDAYSNASLGRPCDRDSYVRAVLLTCLPFLDDRRERGEISNGARSAIIGLLDLRAVVGCKCR